LSSNPPACDLGSKGSATSLAKAPVSREFISSESETDANTKTKSKGKGKQVNFRGKVDTKGHTSGLNVGHTLTPTDVDATSHDEQPTGRRAKNQGKRSHQELSPTPGPATKRSRSASVSGMPMSRLIRPHMLYLQPVPDFGTQSAFTISSFNTNLVDMCKLLQATQKEFAEDRRRLEETRKGFAEECERLEEMRKGMHEVQERLGETWKRIENAQEHLENTRAAIVGELSPFQKTRVAIVKTLGSLHNTTNKIDEEQRLLLTKLSEFVTSITTQMDRGHEEVKWFSWSRQRITNDIWRFKADLMADLNGWRDSQYKFSDPPSPSMPPYENDLDAEAEAQNKENREVWNDKEDAKVMHDEEDTEGDGALAGVERRSKHNRGSTSSEGDESDAGSCPSEDDEAEPPLTQKSRRRCQSAKRVPSPIV
jgi:predicted  nucleic acid-binding Zn-ribbon protein